MQEVVRKVLFNNVALVAQQITKSFIPCAEYIFIICHKIGFPPISIIGLGFKYVSSEILVPKPPAKIITFI